MSNLLGKLPSAAELLDSPPLKSLRDRVSGHVVVSQVRRMLDDLRTQVQSAASSVHVPTTQELAQKIAEWISASERRPVRPVINATGHVLPAGLGPPPLAAEASDALSAASRSYASIDGDLASGQRAPRSAAVEPLLTRLTGAEAAAVVQSDLAGLLLALGAVAAGREALVARGQVAEWASGARLADVAAAAGARLREVGAVTRTRLDDFSAAASEATAAILYAASDEFAVVGGGPSPALAELAQLARRRGVALLAHLPAGTLFDVAKLGISGATRLEDAVRDGVDLAVVPGQRFLGGPECGLLLGRRSLIERLPAQPLWPAVQPAALTLSALEATLRLYADAATAEQRVPLLALLSTPLDNLQQRAERLAPQLRAADIAEVEVVAAQTAVSESDLPGHRLATMCLVLRPKGGTADALAASLRRGTPAVIGRVQAGGVWLDLRSVHPGEDAGLAAACEALRTAPPEPSPATPPSP